jgi:hypothetical protein
MEIIVEPASGTATAARLKMKHDYRRVFEKKPVWQKF